MRFECLNAKALFEAAILYDRLLLIMPFVYTATCLMTFLAVFGLFDLKKRGQYSQSHGQQLQAMRKRKGCNSNLCRLAGPVVPGSSSLPSTLRLSLPFALPCDLPSCPLEFCHSPSVWQHLPCTCASTLCVCPQDEESPDASPEQTPNTTPSSASPTPGTTPDSAKGSGSKQKSTDKAAGGLTASDMVHCHLPCALYM